MSYPLVLRLPILSLLLCTVAGCASISSLRPVSTSPSAVDTVAWSEGTGPQALWTHHTLPGKKPNRFEYLLDGERPALAATSRASASLMRHPLRIKPQALSDVRFSWKVPSLIDKADLARADRDDSTVRVILAFEGDRSRFSARNMMLSELARTVSGEELPYATMMYVWCNQRPVESVVFSPRTDRIRKIVVESGAARLGRWNDYRRDIRADFERAFGEAPGALVGVAVMTDTDNTRQGASAWYGPVRFGGRVIGMEPGAVSIVSSVAAPLSASIDIAAVGQIR